MQHYYAQDTEPVHIYKCAFVTEMHVKWDNKLNNIRTGYTRIKTVGIKQNKNILIKSQRLQPVINIPWINILYLLKEFLSGKVQIYFAAKLMKLYHYITTW